jgi:hypothetical protein
VLKDWATVSIVTVGPAAMKLHITIAKATRIVIETLYHCFLIID